MELVEYTPEHFDALRHAGERAGNATLQHQPFVDHYYASSEFCRMYLVYDDSSTVAGTIGIEWMPFAHDSQILRLGFSTNYHSLKSGVGGLLYLKWLKSCDLGLVFGGSKDTHKILQARKWTYYSGMATMVLNWTPELDSNEAVWRKAAKVVMRQVSRRKLLASYASCLPAIGAGVWVQELREYPDDLIPNPGPFTFRFAPTLAHLRWRYALDLPFARYRAFRILRESTPAGYVILNDQPHQILVAQSDAESPELLAAGTLRAIVAVGSADKSPRMVRLTSCHARMKRLYRQFGFHAIGEERPWALGCLRGSVELPADTSDWLINLDIGDNGLRAPFPILRQGA